MSTPFSLPHNAQEISDAIGQVVNADNTPLSPSTNMVTSQGVKSYVDGSVSNLTTSNFALATLVTEQDAIGSNDNNQTIPTCAAVKDFVDNKGFSSGYTLLGSASASGTASSSGFLIGIAIKGAGTNYTKSSVKITVGNLTFDSSTAYPGGSACLSIPIAAGETYSVTTAAGGSTGIRREIYFKAFA